MELEERKVDIEELAIGMFVYRLDRPWTDTPFPIQGFVVETIDEINILRSYCRHVFIDIVRTRVHERVLPIPREGRGNGHLPSGTSLRDAPPAPKITLEPRNSPLFIDLGDRAPRFR